MQVPAGRIWHFKVPPSTSGTATSLPRPPWLRSSATVPALTRSPKPASRDFFFFRSHDRQAALSNQGKKIPASQIPGEVNLTHPARAGYARALCAPGSHPRPAHPTYSGGTCLGRKRIQHLPKRAETDSSPPPWTKRRGVPASWAEPNGAGRARSIPELESSLSIPTRPPV